MDSKGESKRQETKLEVQSFIGNLKYAIESGNASLWKVFTKEDFPYRRTGDC